MNPKEKAESLLKSMIPHAACETGEQKWISAKQCALIAVKEILFTVTGLHFLTSYWQEVRAELEKM